MATLNRVILLGNLTRDPELRYTSSGTPIASFGLASNRRFRQGDTWQEEVCFIDVVAFGRQAETITAHLSKGRLVLLEGRLRWHSWDGDDGQRRSKHEVIAERVEFLLTPAVQEALQAS
ncbi:MAG: single-stranded DNA-binding protein [Candidatus Tectomicrobia bacterium]